jgi:cytochrome c
MKAPGIVLGRTSRKRTGVNGYRDDADAIADGKKLCTSNYIVCHGADGTGKMGPTKSATRWSINRC